ISTLPRGIGSVLDATDLDPFWAAADETGAVIHIHPSYDAGDTRVNDYGLANAVGRISDAIVAVARLIARGHGTPYRQAQIFPPMGAAGLPFLLGRLKRNHKITPGIADPAEALALLYTDSILHDPRALRFVVEVIGADRVMMGSDMPFPIGDEEPAKIVTAAGLKADQVASIIGGVAQRLFRVGGGPGSWASLFDAAASARLDLPQQPPIPRDAIVHADEAQRVPHASLRRRHHGNAELPLQRLDGLDHRPVRRREKDRVGVRVRPHQRAAHVERGRHRDAAEVIDDLAASHDAEHLAAVAFGVGDQSRVLRAAVRMRHHHFLAGEDLRRLRLRGDA